MLKPFVLAATLTLAFTGPVVAAPDQVWRDIPAEAPIALGLDWRPGQWDALARQPRVQAFLQEFVQGLMGSLLKDVPFDWQAFLPHLGAQAALGANLNRESQRWLVLSWEAQNEAALGVLLADGVRDKKWRRHDLPQGEPLFVWQPERDDQGLKELLAFQVAQGRLRVYVATDLVQVQRLVQSPALAPQLDGRMQAHADKGLWFVGEPEHFSWLSTLLLGTQAKPERPPFIGGPVMMGVGLDAQGLYGQAWQHDQPLLGAPLGLDALAPLVSADSFFFHAFTLKTPLFDTLQRLGEQIDASILGKEWPKWHQAVVTHAGLNWTQVTTGLNGQVAWSAALSPDEGAPIPVLQAYLGTAQPQQSYQALQSMRLNSAPFAELLFGQSVQHAQGSVVRANAHTLQIMVELFGVDYGAFPEDISSLMQAAKGNSPYWREITNPVTHRTGVGQALDSLRNVQQRGFPASVAGQVFYEPVGKRKVTDPAYPNWGVYPGYRIYSYLPDGSTYVLTGEKTPARPEPLTLNPWPANMDHGRRLTWKSAIPSPLLQLSDSVEGEVSLWLAENGGFLRLGNRPEPLLQTPAESLLKRSDFQSAHTQATSRQVVYLHFPKFFQLLSQLEDDLPPTMASCLDSLEHFILEEQATPDGSDLRFRLKADMARFDVATIEACLDNANRIAQAQNHLNLLKTNREALAILIEIQVSANERHLDRIEYLDADSIDAFAHPITELKGVGPRGALIDYADFERFGVGNLPGMLVYQPLHNAQQRVIGFKLYITDLQGQLLRDENGQVSVLEKISDD